MFEAILNEPSIRALVGQGEAASVAQHVGMSEQGQGSGFAVFLQGKLTVDRCNGLRCSLTKNALPGGVFSVTVPPAGVPALGLCTNWDEL
jgi:hypothetical protein